MIKEKEYSSFKCTFAVNTKTNVLIIEYFRKGRLYHRTCVMDATNPFTNKFISQYDENMAKEVYKYNIEII